MTDDALPTPAPGAFDLIAVLQGREYPELAVPFYLDERTAFALAQANKELTRLTLLGKEEQATKLEATIEEMKGIVKQSRYVYHLRGISQKVKDDVRALAYEKYPQADDNGMAALLGQEKANPERDRFFSTALLQVMTTKITTPDGREQVAPTLEQVQEFLQYAPQVAAEAILSGQTELLDGAKGGFELAAQDSDFS